MAAVSVLQPTPFPVYYPDSYAMETFANIAAKTISSYDSESLTPQSLRLGATSHLVMESYADAQIYVRDNSGLTMFQTAYDANGVRTDTQLLDVRSNVLPLLNMHATVLQTGASSNAMWVYGSDSNKTTWVSTMQVRDMNNHLQLSTIQREGFLINNQTEFSSNVIVDGFMHCLDSVKVDGTATIDGLLTVYDDAIINGSIFGKDVNMWRDAEEGKSGVWALGPGEPNRVGFGFRINAGDQLELVKYARFDDGTKVTKKVAVFGNSPLTKNEKLDGTQYLNFDAIEGFSVQTERPPLLVGAGGTSTSVPTAVPNAWIFDGQGNVITSAMVGINVDVPQHRLDIDGTLRVTDIIANGIVTQTFETTSDERLKDISGLVESKSCLDKVKQLEVISFKYNNLPGPTPVRTGLRAQQVREVMDDAVIVRKFADIEDCHLVDTSVIIAYLVGAVKELAAIAGAAA